MMDKEHLEKYIRGSLGEPAISLYVDSSSIAIAIERAITAAKPYMNQKAYIDGITPPVNLTEYGVKRVVKLFESPDSNPTFGTSSGTFDEFSYINFATAGSQMLSEKLIFRACFDMLRAEADVVISKDFRYHNGVLYTDNYRGPLTAEVIMEYTPDNMQLITDDRIVEFIKEFSVACTKETEGLIRRKFTVSSSPFTLDGDNMVSEATSAKEALLRELSENGPGFFIVVR